MSAANSKSKSKKQTKKPAKQAAKQEPAKAPRQLKAPTKKRFGLQRRPKQDMPKLPNSFALFRRSVKILWSNKVLFGGIAAIYIALNLILVRGVAGSGGLFDFKLLIEDTVGKAQTGLSAFLYVIGSSGSATDDAGAVYQTILMLITGLAVIWALRQVHAGAKVRIRDAYYKGMYPVIPVVLVVLVMGLQVIPAVALSTLYGIVVQNGIAVSVLERIIWLIVALVGYGASAWMLISSLFALPIATLPDMQPVQALRSARKLVRSRRWTILRKLILLPIILYAIAAVVMVPIILFATVIAEPAYFILTSLFVTISISYVYTLYRELLNE